MQTITVNIEVNAPIALVWKLWNTPADIKKWNNVSEEWHTSLAERSAP